MARCAYEVQRPLEKRMSAPTVKEGADFSGSKGHKAEKVKQYIDKRHEGDGEG
jgi:hypothetical protein